MSNGGVVEPIALSSNNRCNIMGRASRSRPWKGFGSNRLQMGGVDEEEEEASFNFFFWAYSLPCFYFSVLGLTSHFSHSLGLNDRSALRQFSDSFHPFISHHIH